MKEMGDTLILDNGAYEGVSNWDHLRWGLDTYHPHYACLPDYPLQEGSKTIDAASSFLINESAQWATTKWLYTPQAIKRDIVGWTSNMLLAVEGLPIAGVCIPRLLPLHISMDPLVRANVCEWLRKYHPQLYVHAFGMAAGNVEELQFLREAGCNSIDSSAPVWRGWHRKFISETSGKTVVGDVDFEAPLPIEDAEPTFDDIILGNLECCGVNTSCRR